MIQSKASGLWIVLKGRAFKAFPLSGSGNAHSFAVFCYRAAGDFYAMPGQTFDNHIVGENVVGFFFVGQLFDAVFDGGNRGVLVAGVGSGGRREKVFQFKNTARGVHIFAAGNAADGAFVHFKGVGNVAQQQRFDKFNSFFEKVALMSDDFFGNAQNCRGSLVKCPDQKRPS